MAAPNIIPMADIMLVLLIIFMVVTPMLQKGMSVEMDNSSMELINYFITRRGGKK